ncbi:hypothetical protein CBR_g37998 [Chara braunii]|uniref:Uncharacterized protein n=1 Tax=Chara braunii TaxID=69332 RepID=A0A388LPI5_CHABU|nr:hypothetical protein CBR_g37998 [Chara braunii]|eukprot:GBG84123.1 hypothetical protein CBR_g37998 [Chara braunii]
MDSGGPPVGVQSDRGVVGDTEGRLHGDDGAEDAGVDSSQDGDGREVTGEDTIERVIVGLCAADVEGGLQGVHGTSQMGDVVVEEEAGFCTDRERNDSGAGHSPVMEGGVHVREEAWSSPPRDVEGDMSLALIVRPPSAFYADEGHTGCRMDERPGESTPPSLDQEELERVGMEDPYDHTGRGTVCPTQSMPLPAPYSNLPLLRFESSPPPQSMPLPAPYSNLPPLRFEVSLRVSHTDLLIPPLGLHYPPCAAPAEQSSPSPSNQPTHFRMIISKTNSRHVLPFGGETRKMGC